MSVVVLVVGDGLLADFVYGELSMEYQVVRESNLSAGVPGTVRLALVLSDGWDPSIHNKAEKVFQQAGIPWLRGFISFGEGVVGPLVRPGTPGCSRCADLRRLMTLHDRKEMAELQQRLKEEGLQRDVWASRMGLRQMAHILAAEAQRVLEGGLMQIEGRLFLINLKTLKSSHHFFLPDPLCPICGDLPEDSATAAQVSLQPSPKVDSDSYRSRSMEELKEVLVKDYLDTRTGFLNRKMHDLQTTFSAVGVNLPLFNENVEAGGRTHSYIESELTAILEALERYCGTEPLGKQTVIKDSFRHLGEQALNPALVGLHTKEQYERPNFPFIAFDPDRLINWVWGYSFLQERSILVPETVAYYGMCCEDRFVYECSNGCALGGSLVEAIVYGILEVVERDSFLMTWYAKLPVPRLDPYSAHDQELRLMVNRLQVVPGYDVHLFNTTMENGIPSVWALAKNKNPQGVNLICSAGAHLDPVRAAKSAIHGLAGLMPSFEADFSANRERYERMYHDSFLVQRMEDHAMVYCLPQAEKRLDFLLDSNRQLRTFDEEFKPWAKHDDLSDDLRDILQVFRRLHLDVIVVDQTTPELKRNGLYCVRVLIPGMLPMTFGYDLIRLEGLERVLRIPVELGYALQPLTLDQLNPHPHPFP